MPLGKLNFFFCKVSALQKFFVLDFSARLCYNAEEFLHRSVKP